LDITEEGYQVVVVVAWPIPVPMSINYICYNPIPLIGLEVVDCRASAWLTQAVTTVPPPLSSSSSQLSSQLSFLAVDCIAQMAWNKIVERLCTSSPYSVCALFAGMKQKTYITTQNNDVPTDHQDNNRHGNPIISTTTVAQRIQQQVTAATLSFQPPQDTRHVPVEQQRQQHSSQSESPKATVLRVLRPVLYWFDKYGSMIGHVPHRVYMDRLPICCGPFFRQW
jgi:hypothetical protein